MTYEAILKVMDYAEGVQCAVQITYEPGYTDGWTADFKSDAHAQVCVEELREAGLSSRLSCTVWKNLTRLQ